ncbi:hypothetical protein ACFL5Z_08465 [Planctomycetota bacterium]
MWKSSLLLMAVTILMLSGMTQAARFDITTPGDTVRGVPDDSDWPGNEAPPLAIDDNVGTKYLHFKGFSQPTGFQVTPLAAQTIVVGLTFTTANDAVERDPIAFELYGSNVSLNGPYELIASGDIVDFSQTTAWPRFTMNETPIEFDNDVAYDHYQILFTAVRDAGSANSMQIAEVEFLGMSLISLNPDPADGAIHEDTWASLSWTAGDVAASHDVYFGDDFDNVNEGTADTFFGNQTSTDILVGFPGFPYPDGLVPGTTYYWRIDDIEADRVTKHKGQVWSFWIPSRTAYNPEPADGIEFVDPNTVKLSWTAGFGAVLHTVYFGDNFDEVNNATGGFPQGLLTYSPGPLEREKVYYWRIDEFDILATHKGDIWSFTTPGAVGNPKPLNGATDAGMNAILSWMASDSAASHQLYFGTEKEAVRNADTGSPEYIGAKTLGDESFDPGRLEPDTAYFWRVDEVDSQSNTSTGPLWNFTTGAFLLVDGFEDYTDDDAAGEAIWQSWIDGFGVADNGAQVGYLLPPYAEQTIVHSGAQSMPLTYENTTGATNSEATLTLTAVRDWTEAGVTTLSLWFRGDLTNVADPMYLAISNAAGTPALVAYDNPIAATFNTWTKWVIPLQVFGDKGINLTNVDKIAIGLGTKAGMTAPGGSGTIYVDDIALNQPSSQ